MTPVGETAVHDAARAVNRALVHYGATVLVDVDHLPVEAATAVVMAETARLVALAGCLA